MRKLILGSLIVIFSYCAGCSSKLDELRVVRNYCDSLIPENEILQCYRQQNSQLLTRRADIAVHDMTGGDWPFEYRIIYVLHLTSGGKVINWITEKESNSFKLNKSIRKSVESVSNFYVPEDHLFKVGGFEHLKLVFKPARTPILGEPELFDSKTIVVYVIQKCGSLSGEC